jgi:hypothetical protein
MAWYVRVLRYFSWVAHPFEPDLIASGSIGAAQKLNHGDSDIAIK